MTIDREEEKKKKKTYDAVSGFGYEWLHLIVFFGWIGLELIRFCFGFWDSLSKCLSSQF